MMVWRAYHQEECGYPNNWKGSFKFEKQNRIKKTEIIFGKIETKIWRTFYVFKFYGNRFDIYL